MGFIVAGVGALLGGVAAAVGGIVGGIVGVIGPAVAGIASAVGGIVGGIAEGITAPLAEVVTSVGATVHSIASRVSQGIKNMGAYIDATTKPILDPIREGWKTIKGRIDAVKEYLKPVLGPLEEITDVINTYHEVKILSGLLTGSKGVSQVIKYVGDGKLLEAASAISSLYHMTAEAVTGILEMQEAERKTFDDKLRYVDEGMRTLIGETQSKTLKEVYRKVHDVTGTLTRKIGEVDQRISAIGRRTTDLPWFQSMLIRSLA